MKASTFRAWSGVHTWSSVIATLFLLVLFISGLPLIFRSELESLLGYGENIEKVQNVELASLERIVQAGINSNPGHVVQYIAWKKDLPGNVLLSMAKTPTAHFSDNFNVLIDAGTAELVEGSPSPLDFFLSLHTTLLVGPAGSAFLGLVALLFLVALLSGFIIYGPHMKRLRFGDIRSKSSTRIRWLDFHNLVGAIVLGWSLVVGGTGMINSWGEYVLMTWRSGQLADTVASYKKVPPPIQQEFAPVDTILESALAAAPDLELYYVAAPGSFMSSMHHYSVFMRGRTARTEFLLQPVLIDAKTAEVTAVPKLPGYINALLLCQPLHFGNYGGLPLKILWALFDLATIVLLMTGMVLWLSRRFGKLKVLVEPEHEKI